MRCAVIHDLRRRQSWRTGVPRLAVGPGGTGIGIGPPMMIFQRPSQFLQGPACGFPVLYALPVRILRPERHANRARQEQQNQSFEQAETGLTAWKSGPT